MTAVSGDILVKCQKQAFSFNKREAKVYCYYLLLHVLKAAHACRPDRLNALARTLTFDKQVKLHW
jgi:hypothetical protein